MNLDKFTGTLTVDEHELHDIIVALSFVVGPEQRVDSIKIVPKEPDKFSNGLVVIWEDRMDNLLSRIRRMDGDFHVDAEYTC